MTVELPLKGRHLHPYSKKVGSKSSVSGPTGGKKHKGAQGGGLVIMAQVRKDAQQQTQDNRTVMLLLPNGKRRFVKAKDLK
jgi:hypothetical protein